MLKVPFRLLGFYVAAVFCLLSNAPAHAEPGLDLAARLRSALSISANTGGAVAVYDLRQNRVVFERNIDKPLKPASILKIVTSAVAFSELGPEYRFRTEAWQTGRHGATVGQIFVKGGGDPSFTTEDMWMLARRIYQSGVRKIEVLRLDSGYFVGSKGREGQRAYEAGSSALSLNFNTVTITVCPTTPGQPAYVTIDPWELSVGGGSPFTGQIQTLAKGSSQYHVDERSCSTDDCVVQFRLSGGIHRSSDCNEVYRSVRSPERYFVYTLAGFLRYLGVDVRRVETQPQPIPESASLVATYHSRPLALIIRDMNLYSSNFIAEQLLTAVGFSSSADAVRRREYGLQKMHSFVQLLGGKDGEFQLLDGSGLSHENRISARLILKTLVWAYQQEGLAPEFIASLAVSGRSGTLKRRKPVRKGLVLRAKTGTLTGVSSLAGYLRSQSGNPFAFVVIRNDLGSKSAAEQFEDRVLRLLYES